LYIKSEAISNGGSEEQHRKGSKKSTQKKKIGWQAEEERW